MKKNARLRLLLIMEQILEQTDEEHGITMQDMIDWLAEHDITGERKSIYEDIHALQEYGLDIRYVQKDKTYRMYKPEN